MRITRIAATGCALAAAITFTGTAAASAEPPTAPVTITLSPEQVTFLCGQRLPKMETRVTKLIERINGGADVKGSVAALKDRAQKEREAGREASAQLLEEKAERRAGKIDELNKIKGWVTDFRSKYCGGAK